MKKTIILILGGAAALALSLVLGINAQSKAESVNGLFEANVEALAGVEHRGACGNSLPYCEDLCPNCKKWSGQKGIMAPAT